MTTKVTTYDSEVQRCPPEAEKRTRRSFVRKKPRPMMSLEEASDTAAEKGSGEVMAHLLFEAYPRKGKRYPKLTYEDWLSLLGDQWTRCDRGISLFKPELQEALPRRGPVRLMMTDEENTAYDRLPEVVTFYRGCDANSASLPGICWSLNKDVANLYPFLSRFQAKKPTVLTACVRKHWILAVKLGRREEEIITFAAEVKMIRPADSDRADVYRGAYREAEEDGGNPRVDNCHFFQG
jgi:hypothetical protein